jgi:cellulose synthase/poly-beta-1,6-N-acetylglucosamine synthase-like glycosyltransferase
MARAFFWGAGALVGYSYLLFPVIVFLRALLRPRPHLTSEITPLVSVVIAAHNEEESIGRKLDGLTNLDYPVDHLQIIIASDGSTDRTARIVTERQAPNVTLLNLPRGGKAAALNAGVAAARGEIVVLSDANSIFAPDAIRAIVGPFADAEVGGVAGNQVYSEGGNGDATSRGERSYWDFDRMLKTAQSRAGNVIAGTGALYAIRRELFRPVPAGVNDDFYLSLAVIDSGRRLVFEPDARAFESVASSSALEYRRKVRIMTRGLRCAFAIPRLLDPRRSGFYAVQLFSHKVLMRTMALPLITIAVTSVMLAPRGVLYRLAAAGQAIFGLLGLAGLLLADRPLGHRRVLALPAYFCLVQLASLHATWNLLRGRSYERWEPGRESNGPGDRRTALSAAEQK